MIYCNYNNVIKKEDWKKAVEKAREQAKNLLPSQRDGVWKRGYLIRTSLRVAEVLPELRR